MKSKNKFALCVSTDQESLLTLHKLYKLIPDASAERSDYIRVIDDEGEDYLYPKKHFVILPVPQDVEDILLHAA